MKQPDLLVVGAGVFGLAAAIELHDRGHGVAVVDPGPIPHPLAASTDISKVVRMEYGSNHQYMEMVEQSIRGFLDWNDQFEDRVYHHLGVTMFTCRPMAPGGFQFESYQTLLDRGHAPERLQGNDLSARFPAWSKNYIDGFYNPEGGYVESGRMIAHLAALARSKGVEFIVGQVARVNGPAVELTDGTRISAGTVVVAAGAWTRLLVPEIRPYLRSTGHPVFHLAPTDPTPFQTPRFCTFTADVARTGWYGFPFNPREQVVKVANHGVGKPVHPAEGERAVYQDDHEALRDFLRFAFPSLVDAEVVYTRRCLYSDTLDEHLWIDHHPGKPGLVVATGGSGHGMKFAPVLGGLIADAVERKPNPWLERFRWRHLGPDTQGEEAARHRA